MTMTKQCLYGLVKPIKTEQIMGLDSVGDNMNHLKENFFFGYDQNQRRNSGHDDIWEVMKK